MGAQYIFTIIIQELCNSERIQQLSFPSIPLQESFLGAHCITRPLFLYLQALSEFHIHFPHGGQTCLPATSILWSYFCTPEICSINFLFYMMSLQTLEAAPMCSFIFSSLDKAYSASSTILYTKWITDFSHSLISSRVDTAICQSSFKICPWNVYVTTHKQM